VARLSQLQHAGQRHRRHQRPRPHRQGPWQNAKGAVIGKDVDDLHKNPGITKDTLLDEKGERIKVRGDTPNMHDMLTGSDMEGKAFPPNMNLTCNNWSSSTFGSAMLATATAKASPTRSTSTRRSRRTCRATAPSPASSPPAVTGCSTASRRSKDGRLTPLPPSAGSAGATLVVAPVATSARGDHKGRPCAATRKATAAQALAQFAHHPEGVAQLRLLAQRLQGGVAAELRLRIPVVLSEFTPRIGGRVALRHAEAVVVQMAEHELAFAWPCSAALRSQNAAWTSSALTPRPR